MKMRNRIFAVILSLVLLLSALPLSVFADDAVPQSNTQQGATGGGSGSDTSNQPPVVVGEGADGTLTIKIDPSDFMEALQGEYSLEALVELLKKCVDRSNGEFVNMNVLMELVPINAVMTILLGEERENASAFIKQLGGINAILAMVDENRLILTADRQKLIDFVNGLEHKSDIFNFGNIFNELDPDRQKKLEEDVKHYMHDEIHPNQVTADKFKNGMYFQAVEEALADAEKSISNYCDPSVIAQYESVRNAVITKVKSDLSAMNDTAKAEYLEQLLTAEAYAALENAILQSTLAGQQFDMTAYAANLIANDLKVAKVQSIAVELLNSGNTAVYEAAVAEFNRELFLQECGGYLEELLIADAEYAILHDVHDQSKYFIESFIDELALIVFNIIDENGFTITVEDINTLFGKIQSNDLVMDDVIHLDVLFDGLEESHYNQLFNLLSIPVLVDELKDDLETIFRALTKDQIEALAVAMLSQLMQKVETVYLDGYHVANRSDSQDTSGMLTFNYTELMKFAAAKLPTLTDIANNQDGKLLSFVLYTIYQTDAGDTVTKDVKIDFVFEGDMEPLRRVAAKLAQYISVNREGDQIYIDLTMPAIITEAYARFLSSEKGASIRDSVLGLAGKTGEELREVLRALTLEQLIDLLSKVDIEELYSTIMTISEVETLMEMICDKLEIDLDITKLQDLNTVLDAIANGVPSLQAVCDAVSRRLGKDVMAMLKKAASFADRNQTVQSFLDEVAKIPYLGKYIDGKSFTEILENYKDVDPAKAVADYISKKVNADVYAALQNYDANELYQKALEKAKDYEKYYNKVKNFVLNMLDPNFKATTTIQKIVQTLIPDGLLEQLLDTSLLSAYIDNTGSFYIGDDKIDINFGAWGDLIVGKLAEKFETLKKYEDTLKAFLPKGTATFGLHLTVKFQNLSKVTYTDIAGNELFATFLPNGTNPQEFWAAPEIEFESFQYWGNADKEEVTSIEGDTVLSPVYKRNAYNVFFKYQGAQDAIYQVTVDHEKLLSSGKDENGAAIVIPTPLLGDYIENATGKWVLVWTLIDGTKVTPDEMLNMVIKADTVFTFSFEYIPYVAFRPEGSDELFGEKFYVESGSLLSTGKDENGNPIVIPTYDDLKGYLLGDDYNGTWNLVWKLNGNTVTPDAMLSMTVDADTVFEFSFVFEEGSELVKGENATVTKDGDNWTANIESEAINLVINPQNGNLSEIDSLTVKTETGVEIKLDTETLEQLGASGDQIVLSYNVTASERLHATEFYTYEIGSVYTFEVTVGGEVFCGVFAGEVKVSIPFEGVASNGDQRTALYWLKDNGKIEPVEDTVVVDAENDIVSFVAPHFSQYFIENEYKITSKFVGLEGNNPTTNVDGQWIPVGAVISKIRPTLGDTTGKFISKIEYFDTVEYAEENATAKGTLAKVGDGLKMPNYPVTVVFTAEELADAETAYIVNGTKYDTKTEAEQNIVKKVGYTTDFVSIGGNQYVLVYKPITYTLKFEGAGSITFTVENAQSLRIPDLQSEKGYDVYWKDSNGQKLVKLVAADLIAQMTEEPYELSFTKAKDAQKYNIYLGNTKVGEYTFGESAAFTVAVPAGQKFVSLTYAHNEATDSLTEAANGSYTVANAYGDLYLTLVTEAQEQTVSVVDGNGNKTDLSGKPGDTLTFTVTVPKGQVLANISYGNLISLVVNANGSKTLTYAFVVTEEVKQINYTVSVKVPNVNKLANGLLTNEETPVSAIENLIFANFAAPDSMKFFSNEYQFAIFEPLVEEASLLWLWILIALVVIVTLITILYRLYVNGKLKPNFFLRFITWIVSVFFNICLAVSGLVLLMTQGTTKKENVNFEAFGLRNPDDGHNEDDVVTTVEKDTAIVTEAEAPAVEEAAEEVTEEVTEEATEEITEEATDANEAEEENSEE